VQTAQFDYNIKRPYCCFETDETDHGNTDQSRTHDFHLRFSCLSRLLKYLGGHLKSLKLFKTQHNVAEKAGVGGSTPSLATTFQRLYWNHLLPSMERLTDNVQLSRWI